LLESGGNTQPEEADYPSNAVNNSQLSENIKFNLIPQREQTASELEAVLRQPDLMNDSKVYQTDVKSMRYGGSSVPGLFSERQGPTRFDTGMSDSAHNLRGVCSIQPVSSSRPPMSVASIALSQLDDGNTDAIIRAYKKKKAELEMFRDKFYQVETKLFTAK